MFLARIRENIHSFYNKFVPEISKRKQSKWNCYFETSLKFCPYTLVQNSLEKSLSRENFPQTTKSEGGNSQEGAGHPTQIQLHLTKKLVVIGLFC